MVLLGNLRLADFLSIELLANLLAQRCGSDALQEQSWALACFMRGSLGLPSLYQSEVTGHL